MDECPELVRPPGDGGGLEDGGGLDEGGLEGKCLLLLGDTTRRYCTGVGVVGRPKRIMIAGGSITTRGAVVGARRT